MCAVIKWDFQSCRAWTQDQQSHQLTLPVWESGSHELNPEAQRGLLPREPQRQACSQGPGGQKLNHRGAFLRLMQKFKQTCPSAFWTYLVPFHCFLPSDMGMSIPCLFHCYILEAYNPVQLYRFSAGINLLKDKLYFKSHPHLI